VILEECGPPSKHGVNDGSLEVIKELWAETRKYCVDEYSIKALSELRAISYYFNGSLRGDPVCWGVYRIARSPEVLAALIAQANGRKLTVSLARKLLKPPEPERKEQPPRPLSLRDRRQPLAEGSEGGGPDLSA